jgi:hypothetical protein
LTAPEAAAARCAGHRAAAHLAEVTGVVLVEVDAVVVLPAGVTAASRVLPVLANAAVAGADVAALLAVVLQLQTRRHGAAGAERASAPPAPP